MAFCPFIGIPTCSHKHGHFTSFRGLAQHVAAQHAKAPVVPYADSTAEDGTLKIPCPNGCGVMSTTHQKANHHAKMSPCKDTGHTNVECPWKSFTGCREKCSTAKAMGHHISKHRSEPRSSYVCQYDKCGIRHADLYRLAAHEERSTFREKAEKETCHRSALDDASKRGVPPSLIIVNRSSAHTPKAWWYAGKAVLKEGLHETGRSLLHEYSEMKETTHILAVLHTCSNCSTRELPAVEKDKTTQKGSKKSLHAHLAHHRALCFTKAICTDVEAANRAGVTPTILSIGIDGWACDERRLHPWLQNTKLEFKLTMRLNGLHYGMTDIKRAFELGPGHDPKSDELIACWKTFQSGKDTTYGVNVGRNTIASRLTSSTMD